MATIAMLKSLGSVGSLAASAQTAEKSRVAAIRAEAAKLFAEQLEAYNEQQRVANTSALGGPHAELQVVMAEVAFATDNLAVARKLLERFLQTGPQKDQFYCRAKTLLGLLIDRESTDAKANGINSIKQRKLALAELLLALDVATAPENVTRYKFVVFNISAACWRIVSPFLRADRAKNFIVEMNRVCAALEAIDDANKKWRIDFLAATAVCYADDKQAKEASDRLDKAIEYAEKLLSEIVSIDGKLSDEAKKCISETEAIMSALRQVDEREEAKRRKPKIDPDAEEGVETKATEPVELPPLEGLAALGYAVLRERLNESQAVKATAEASLKQNGEEKLAQQEQLGRLYSQRVHVNVPDFKKVQGASTVTQALRLRTLVQLQCLVSGAIVDKDWAATFAAVLADLEKAAASTTGSSAAVVTETLLDACRVAWTLNQRDVAVKCCELAEKGASSGPSIRVKLDLCKAIAIVANIASESANAVLEQRLAQKQVEGFAASRRIEAIKILERTLTMCLTRLEDTSLSQEICIAIWNTALPLLQPHVRHNVHRAFQLAAGALEEANSPLALLRSQLHFELAKCEESTDFISKAKEEGERAMACDYGSLDDKLLPTAAIDLDRNRSMDHLVSPLVHLLDVRSNVYDAPTDPESQVLLLIQQMKETSSRAVQKDALGKAMVLMSVALGASGALEPLPLEEVEAALLAPRNSDYAAFSMLLQQQVAIMAQLAQLALGLKNIPALQHACRFVLSHRLEPADPFMRPSLDRQIDAHFLLAESLVEQLSGLWLDDEREKLFLQDQDASEEELLDPRSLGTTSKYATEDMQRTKRLVLLSLQRGMELAAALKDEYGVQNGVIYFWNLHLHLFRNGLHTQALPELVDFLSKAMIIIAALPSASASPAALASSTNPLAPTPLDDRLRLQLVEGLSGLHEAQGNLPQAIEASLKAAAGPGSAYLRKRVVEQVSRQTLSSAAPGAGAGGKGGAKPVELPKFDQPFLLVFSALAQAELPPSVLPREQVAPLVDKAATLMDTEVVAMLQQQDWDNLTQETYDQLLEMQAEAWTRITRAKIRAGDVQGSQATAERCMGLIAEGMMLDSDKRKLSPRVWRWVSVCERYFSSAILQLIQPEGQDLSLQSELRLAALRHLFLSADYAHRAGKEDLVIAAAVEAWNASIALLDTANSAARHSLSSLHRQFIDALLKLKGKPEGGDAATVGPLLQNLYLALIGAFAAGLEWDAALAVVNEAFQSVPAALQKPLWKWRVVVMSKKGKDVMASLSKLKEGDSSLQARVYATLARAASAPQQQLDAYRKTVDILKDDMERVDYLLETAQWLGSSGVPRVEIAEVVQAALDAIYEVEEQSMPLKVDDSLDLDSQSTASRSSTRSAEQQQAVNKTSAGKSGGGGTAGGKRSADRAGTAGSKPGSRRGSVSGSRAGTRDIFSRLAIGVGGGGVPEQLNCKQLEQTLRSLSMLAMLESNDSTRRDRCTELPYFLRRLLTAWQDTILEAAKLSAYAKLPLLEREAMPYEAFLAPDDALAGLALPVDNEMDLLKWQPSDRFMELMTLVVAEQPLVVPSLESFCSLPLTLHCLLWAASQLAAFSLPKPALLLLGCLRAVVTCLPLPAAEQNSALAMLHFRSLVVATDCGLAKEAQALPTTFGRSSVTCTEFVQSLASVPVDAQTVRQLESNASEQLSVFGFSSFTSAITGVDPLRCALELAGDLTKMGQLTMCRGLTEGLIRDFAIKQWPRERLLARTLLAELDLLQGRFGDALSSLLSCAQVMQACGDSSLIARHTAVVCAAYQRAGQSSEARRVVQDAIEALHTFSFLLVASPTDEASSQGLSRSISRGAAGSLSRGASRGGSKKSSVRAAISPNERSREALLALESCSNLLLSIIVSDAAAAVTAGKDARPFISEAVLLCDKLQETAVLVCGSNSLTQARALGAKAWTQARVLSLLHASASAATGLRPGQYPQWLIETLQQCIEWQGRGVDIRRGLLSQISLSDQTYDVAPPPPAPVVEDPKAAKKGAPPPVAAPTTPPTPETVFLSLPIARETASAENFLAELHLTLARLKADDVSIPPTLPTASTSPVERFLIETSQPESFAAQDFSLPPTFAAIQLTASAMALLAPTEPTSSDSASAGAEAGATQAGGRIESEVLHHAAIIARSSGAGAYNTLWPTPAPASASASAPASASASAPVEGGEGASASASDAVQALDLALPLPREMLHSRSRLLSLVGPILKRASTSTLAAPVAVSLGLTALIDSFGKIGQLGPADVNAALAAGGCSNAAAVFILALQSVRARDWLLKVWQRSAPASSHAAAAFARLQSLELSGAPHPSSVPQMAADVRFLNTSCPAWSRLSVASDPSAILARLGGGVSTFCLTLDHASRSLYVAAGAPAPASASASACQWTAQGRWVVERGELDESSRRILQTLIQQHRMWVEDCARFVNIYGESVSQDQDLVGCDGRMGGKLLKTERSLEERLRALVADLETALSGVLGPGGAVSRLFSSLGESASSCMLLLDPSLHSLPFEALAAFAPFAGRVVRDFSVHVMGHRLDSFAPSPAAAAAAAPAKGAAPAAATALPSPTLPASAVQTLVEPFGDDGGCRVQGFERPSIDDVYAQIVAAVPGAGKWTRIAPAPGTLSLQDLTSAVSSPAVPVDPKNPTGPSTRRPVGLFVHSTGRFGSMLAPSELAVGVDLRALLLLVVCDLGSCDASYRRQNVQDNAKSPTELSLEEPLAVQALAALGGVGCSVFQRWATPLLAQARFVSGLWAALGAGKAPVAQAVASACLCNQPPGQGQGQDEDEAPPQIKPWLRLSRVTYGLPGASYADA